MRESHVTQRAQAIKRRKQIWEALHPAEIQAAQIGSPEIGYGRPPPQEQGFAASTASVSGESKTAINRHLARAEAIGDDLERVTGISMNKASLHQPQQSLVALINRSADLHFAIDAQPCRHPLRRHLFRKRSYIRRYIGTKEKSPLPFR